MLFLAFPLKPEILDLIKGEKQQAIDASETQYLTVVNAH